MTKHNILPQDKAYNEWIHSLGNRYRQSQIKAAVRVNSEQLQFYWSLGRDIVEQQAESTWGDGFYKNLSKDLRTLLPESHCFSETNLKYMKYFYLMYERYTQFCPQVGDELPIYTEHSDIKKITIRPQVGDEFQQEISQQVLTDIFLIPWGHHRFLIELGSGFAYMGREYRLQVGTKEQFMDLLFYVTRLHCYLVIEVKVTDFEPAYLGQLSAYMSFTNHILKTEHDNPTIGLLICKSKDNIFAQYSLEGYNQPIGISEFEGVNVMPEEFKSSLPTIEELEAGLNKE